MPKRILFSIFLILLVISSTSQSVAGNSRVSHEDVAQFIKKMIHSDKEEQYAHLLFPLTYKIEHKGTKKEYVANSLSDLLSHPQIGDRKIFLNEKDLSELWCDTATPFIMGETDRKKSAMENFYRWRYEFYIRGDSAIRNLNLKEGEFLIFLQSYPVMQIDSFLGKVIEGKFYITEFTTKGKSFPGRDERKATVRGIMSQGASVSGVTGIYPEKGIELTVPNMSIAAQKIEKICNRDELCEAVYSIEGKNHVTIHSVTLIKE